MSLAAAIEVSPLARGAVVGSPAPRVLVVSTREDLRWLLGPLGDAGLGGATVKRTAVPPIAEALPDLLVIDDRGEVGLAGAWRRWLTGPGAGVPAVILGPEPGAADESGAVLAATDAGPGRIAAAIATAFERGRAATVQAQLSQRAARSERRLTAFLDHGPETFVMLDRLGRIVYVAPSSEAVQGYPAADLVGKDLFALLHPDDQLSAQARFQGLLSAPRAMARMTVRRRHPRGHYQWIEVTATNLLDEPSVAAIVASFHSVDEREAAMVALRATETRFQQIVRALPVALWSQRTRDGALEYVSPHAAAIFGRPVDALISDPTLWRQAIPADDHAELDAVARIGGTVEHRVVRPDGSIAWVEAQLTPIVDERGDLVRIAGVARDVTDRRRLDDQLDGTRRLAPMVTLAGTVAHDLNNFIAGLQIQCDLLLQGELSAEVRDDVTSLLEIGQRANAMSRRLLDFVRRTPPSPGLVDVGELVRRTAPALTRLLGRTIAVEVAIDDALPSVFAEATQLERALIQLGLNARDALPDGGTVRLAVRAEGSKVVLQVADDGIGMDQATRRDATTLFFTTRPGVRAGMGLTVVAQTVRHHHGSLRLEGAPGQGTTVTIELPARS